MDTGDEKRAKIAQLRAKTTELTELVGKARNDVWSFSALPEGTLGIPRGAITEISGRHGTGKTQLVLNFLTENPTTRAAWIEEDLTIYPRAIWQKKIDLNRILFVEARENFAWALQQVLKSGIFEILILSGRLNELQLRRLQLDAKKSRTSCILLRESPTLQGRWPIALQLGFKTRRQLEILKGMS
ncbi:MAG: hypothetical protein H7222_14290 [Methylotenera sp.]|nr:hypothetical protein [Oligoflexia bacterium]